MVARHAASPARLRRLTPLWLLSPVLLLLTLWTWTEAAAVTLHVTGDRCTAVLYGRSSTIDCRGLAGGRLTTTLVAATDATANPLARFVPPPRWSDMTLTDDGAATAADPLPSAFDVSATLRRPRQPAGLVLLRPDGHTGYAFILDAANRRGAWWVWADEPTTPLRGVPLDRPFIEQAKPFLRQLLAGWPAAAILAALATLSAALPPRPRPAQPTNDPRPTTNNRHSPFFTRHSSLVARHSFLLPLLLLTFALTLHVTVNVLERIPHVQDSVTYHFQAQTLARGALTAPAPPLAAADATAHFEQEFLLVRDGRWFGKYPPGWPAVLALGVAAGGPWLVNPLLAVVSVALLYQLARKRGGEGAQGHRDAGEKPTRHSPPATRPTAPLNTDLLTTVYCLLPPLLLTTSPFFLFMSGSFMAHPAELLWAVLFMVAWSRALAGRLPTRPMRRWAVVAGLALGALFLTRQFTALTIGLAFGASHFLKCVAPSLKSARNVRRTAEGATHGGEVAPSLKSPRNVRRTAEGATHGGEVAPSLKSARNVRRTAEGATHGGEVAPSLKSARNVRRTAEGATHGGEWGATHRRRCIAQAGLALLAALPLLLALPLYQLAVAGDARTDPRLLYWPYDRVGFGPGVGESQNVFTMTMTDGGPAVTWYTDPTQPPRGHSPARGLYNLGRNLDALQRDLFGWPPFFTLAFVWLAFLLRRPAVGDWLLLVVVLAVGGGYVAYWAAGIAYGPRYFYAALPALVILTARGVAALAARGGWRVAGGVLLLLVGYNLTTLPGRMDDYRGYNFVSGAGQRAVAAAVETPALVFVTASETDWWEYGAFFSGNTPWLEGPIVYARDRGAAENARLRAAFPARRGYLWTGERLLPIEE